MEFVLELVADLVAEEGFPLLVYGVFKIPGLVRDLWSDSLQTVFSRQRLD